MARHPLTRDAGCGPEHCRSRRRSTGPRPLESLHSREIVPFLEGTDVFYAPSEGTHFEASIFPHLVAWQNLSNGLIVSEQRLPLCSAADTQNLAVSECQARALGRLTTLRRVDKKSRMVYWAITGTPAVRLRMYKQVSNPVRTPSYMPKGTVQALLPFGVSQALTTIEGNRQSRARAGGPTSRPRVDLLELHGVFGHHSNGQDGCFYRGQVRVDNSENCVPDVSPTDAQTAAQLINKQDGSFSTNYIKAGANLRRNWLSENDDVANKEVSGGAEIEYHPAAWMDSHEVNLYGRTRLRFSFEAAWRDWKGLKGLCRSRVQLNETLTFIIGAPSTVHPVANIIQASCSPTPSGGWGVFGRLYDGQDYYNMGFLDQVTRVEIGFTFNQDGFFRFLIRPNP